MPLTRPIRPLERSAPASLWRNTLAAIPTAFGRLAYLASLRNQNTGNYEHHGLALIFGAEEADRAIRETHRQVFGDWLCYRLEQQRQDLEAYLSGLEVEPGRAITTWSIIRNYRTFVPAEAREAEQMLYLADLETLLAVLRNELGVSLPDPDA
jgi:hypothetical protein